MPVKNNNNTLTVADLGVILGLRWAAGWRPKIEDIERIYGVSRPTAYRWVARLGRISATKFTKN